jgi:hypothetical protein
MRERVHLGWRRFGRQIGDGERILVMLARSSDVGSSDDVDDDLAGFRGAV